jgi:UDP-glucose 4-epimerase
MALQAYKAVGESTEIPLTYYANNVSATLSLLQIMDEYDCTRIVYSSSATVYGTPPTIPIPESTRLKADSPYGKSKVMSEMIIDDLCHGKLGLYEQQCSQLSNITADTKRWRGLSLRYFKYGLVSSLTSNWFTHSRSSPAGAHPSGLIGEDPRGRPGNLLPLLAHMAIGRVNESTLKVFGNDYPTPYALFHLDCLWLLIQT